MMQRSFWAICFGVTTLWGCAPSAQAQQVYVGVADQWNELVNQPEQWKFVRENADGFYVNFIEMNWLTNNPRLLTPEKLASTAALFKNKSAIMESDHKDASASDDQRYISQLHNAGFTVPFTSLNYGWSAARSNNLKNFALKPGQEPRLNFVQAGPWVLDGDVMRSNPKNDALRAAIDGADGVSTDGPMGFWLSDQGKMRAGSISLVKYAHQRGKKALVMLCPYGAGNKLYTPAQALAVSQLCVREHEDAGAIPDIWAVFEYATDIPAVPEAAGGSPLSTTTGMAYWLIHHLQDPGHAARLSLASQEGLKSSVRAATALETAGSNQIKEVTVTEVALPLATGEKKAERTVTYELRNSNPWLDLCPVLRAEVGYLGPQWTVSATLNGVDVTQALLGKTGVECVGDFRLWHRSNPPFPPHQLKINVTCQTPLATAEKLQPLEISLLLSPHPSFRDRIQQKMSLQVTAQSEAEKP